MKKRALIPIAEGFEEIEAITIVDILRRAGAEVVVAGVSKNAIVTGRSAISIIPDLSFDAAFASGSFDIIFLPGGLPNAHILRDDERIVRAVKEQFEKGGYVAAICAAPLVLERAGLLTGIAATSHPSCRDELVSCDYTEKRVVVSNNVITSRAPGTAMELAFTLVEILFGKEKAREVNTFVLAHI